MTFVRGFLGGFVGHCCAFQQVLLGTEDSVSERTSGNRVDLADVLLHFLPRFDFSTLMIVWLIVTLFG